MGRRKPQARRPGRAPIGLPTSYRNDADAMGDGVSPFLVSGGRANFLELGEGGLFGAENGVQLVCSVYVPNGRVGWVKQLRVAPRLPAQLGQGWRGVPLRFEVYPPGVIRAPAQVGVWETPMGWESYTDNLVTPLLTDAPQWRWHLTMLQGTIENARQQVNPQNLPFDPLDPATYYLLPELAVNADAYGTGLAEPSIPGSSAGAPWSGQRMQVLQADELTTHVMIPPDHTACLFARWTQTVYQPRFVDGETLTVTDFGFNIYPLWPSFGQLLGYTQPTTTDAAQANAKFGWGG